MKTPLITLTLLAACACAPSHETKAAAPAAKSTTTQPQPPSTLPQVDTQATQSASAAADRALEQHIRQALTADSTLATATDALTVTAHGGSITLRGSVASQAEKDSILSKVKALPGVVACDDQLEVKM
jgi:osmotically-inducible protein OsmY